MTTLKDYTSSKLPPVPAKGRLRLAHTADNHLRLTQTGSRERGADFKHAFMDVMHKASRRGCKAVVAAGDLLDKSELSSPVVRDLADVLSVSDKLGLQLLTVQGNHDIASPNWVDVIRHGREMISVIDNKQVELRVDASLPPLRMYGIPFVAPATLRRILAEVRERRCVDVLVWHGPVAEFADFHGEYVKLEDFNSLGTAAVLLGDIHKTAYTELPDTGLIGYPGATELCKRDEPLEHSFTLIDFAHDGTRWHVEGVELVPVDSRPTKALRIDSQEQLAQAVAEVRQWAAQSHRPVQIFIKYSSEVDNVRGAITEACGPTLAIVRAESYDRAVMAACAKLEKEGSMQGLETYFSRQIADSWGADLAAQLLAAPVGSNYGALLQDAVTKIVTT